MNVGNAGQSVTELEMISTSPRTETVSSLSGTKYPPYLWIMYGICKKGPAKHRTILNVSAST
jgi:hypothetical protein